MRIVSLAIQNVKAIKAIATPLRDGVNVVGGRNGQGKTSFLDAVMYALGGNKSLPEQPVRRGTDKAVIDIDLGELKAHKEITPDGRVTFKVTGKTGGKTPQALLDSIRSDLTFDPTEFARLDPKAQLALLKKLVGLDFTALDEERASFEQERLLVGRELKQLQGQLQGMPHDERAPTEKQDGAAIAGELAHVRAENAKVNSLKVTFAGTKAAVERAKLDLTAAENQLKAVQNAIKTHKERVEALTREKEALMMAIEGAEIQDEQELIDQLQNVQRLNAQVEANAARAKVKAQVEAKNAEYSDLTGRIQAVDVAKQDAMKAARFPVKTLSFNETGVLVAGVPWNQASAAEQLRVSLAMGCALNPTLRVMLIRDGSLLDADSMAIISQMAEENDFQVLVERVGEGDEGAIIIEDGRIKE